MSAMAGQKSWPEFERDGWNARVGPYHAFFGPISEQIALVTLDCLDVGPGVRVLDVCCGPGYLAGTAGALGADAHGVDIAENMIALATRLHPHASFRAGEATALPWADASFDAVVCGLGIHHVSHPEVALGEFARVLRSGGRVAFSVWDDGLDGLAVLRMAVYDSDLVIPEEIPSPPPVLVYGSADQAAPSLEAAGLVLDYVKRLSLTQRYASAEALWNGWVAATIRANPILEAQPADERRRVRAVYDQAISAMTMADGSVEISLAVQVVVGHRP